MIWSCWEQHTSPLGALHAVLSFSLASLLLAVIGIAFFVAAIRVSLPRKGRLDAALPAARVASHGFHISGGPTRRAVLAVVAGVVVTIASLAVATQSGCEGPTQNGWGSWADLGTITRRGIPV